MAITHFKSYIRITNLNKPNQKLTTSIAITNVTNIHIKLFAEDIQQLKRGNITKQLKKIGSIRSAVNVIRKKLQSEQYAGARRYGISLPAFNSIAHDWAQRTIEMSSWTRGDKFHICISYFQISYLQAKNRKLSRKDKCYEKDFEVKLIKMSKQIKRNIKTSRKKLTIYGKK